MPEVYKTELLKLSDKFKRVIAERETKQGEHRIASSDLYLKRASMSPLKRFARALSLSRKLSKLRHAESESKKAIVTVPFLFRRDRALVIPMPVGPYASSVLKSLKNCCLLSDSDSPHCPKERTL